MSPPYSKEAKKRANENNIEKEKDLWKKEKYSRKSTFGVPSVHVDMPLGYPIVVVHVLRTPPSAFWQALQQQRVLHELSVSLLPGYVFAHQAIVFVFRPLAPFVPRNIHTT